MSTTSLFFKSIISLLLLFVVSLSVHAAKGPTYVDRKGVAIRGYDTVAYFTEKQPVKGSKEFQYEWNGGLWQFSSAEHLEMFKQSPEKYAPQYGGYCAYAVANRSYARIDPNVFTILNNKLYLNYNDRVKKRWTKKRSKFIVQADEFWPQLLAEQQIPEEVRETATEG